MSVRDFFLFRIPHADKYSRQYRDAYNYDREHAEVRLCARLKLICKWSADKEPCAHRNSDYECGGKNESDPVSHGSTFKERHLHLPHWRPFPAWNFSAIGY